MFGLLKFLCFVRASSYLLFDNCICIVIVREEMLFASSWLFVFCCVLWFEKRCVFEECAILIVFEREELLSSSFY